MSHVTIGLKTPADLDLVVGDKVVTLNGYNKTHLLTGDPTGYTENVPEEHWKAWLEKFKDHPLHRNGLIFAQATINRTKAEAVERKNVKSGLEALDKAKLDEQAKG